MINKISNLLHERHFILYVTIGLSGVVIDFLLYLALVHINVPATFASFVSVSIAVINNFFLNRKYNFKKKDHILQRLTSFYLVGLTGAILSVFFIYILHTIFGFDAVWAKVTSIPLIVLFQYWFNKNISFATDRISIPLKEITLFLICLAVMSLFALNGPYYSFTDEDDNLLGAQFIAQGQGVIYKDYFSHHMPLTYFVTVPLFLLFGSKLVAIKVAFGLLMGSWLLIMSRHLLKKYGLPIFGSFTLLIALSQMLTWSNMVLAETLIAFTITHSLILFATRKSRNTNSDALLVTLLGAVPVLSALSYAPISILLYLMGAYIFIERSRRAKKISKSFILLAVAALATPYLLLLAYIIPTHSLSEMKEQAITFNTQYYSQFSTSAATGAIDAGASIIQGTIGSYLDSITFSDGSHPQPLSFLFSLGITAAIIVLLVHRKFALLSVFLIAILFGASRYGFTSVFTNDGLARSGIILSFIGMLLIILAINLLTSKRTIVKERLLLTALLVIPLTMITLASITQIADTVRDYQRGNSTVFPTAQPGSSSTIINLVADENDYYWLGPIDFSSQIHINAKNASIHRFYAPWHGACDACTAELIRDIREKNPLVISYNNDMSIWNIPVSTYSKELVDSFANKYYTLDDPRLKHTYFRLDKKNYINAILSETGYDTGD